MFKLKIWMFQLINQPGHLEALKSESYWFEAHWKFSGSKVRQPSNSFSFSLRQATCFMINSSLFLAYFDLKLPRKWTYILCSVWQAALHVRNYYHISNFLSWSSHFLRFVFDIVIGGLHEMSVVESMCDVLVSLLESLKA